MLFSFLFLCYSLSIENFHSFNNICIYYKIMNNNFNLTNLNYFAFLGDWGQVLRLSLKYPKDPQIILLKSVAYYHLNDYNSGLSVIPSSLSKEYQLGEIYIKSELYNLSNNYELSMTAREKEMELLNSLSESGLYNAFEICIHLNLEKECFDIITKLGYGFRGLLARGLFELINKDKDSLNSAYNNITKALELKSTDPDALFALIRICHLLKKYNDIQANLTLLETENYDVNNYLCFLLEKCKVYFLAINWNNLNQYIEKCLDLDDRCLIAYKYNLLIEIGKNGDMEEALNILHLLKPMIEKPESGTIHYILEIFKLVNRICGRDITILIFNLNYLLKLYKNHKIPELILEIGTIYLMIEDTANASHYFKEANSLMENSNDAIIKMIECNLADNKLTEAESQYNFIKEVFTINDEKPSELTFLSAIIETRKTINSNDISKEQNYKLCLNLFEEALKTHIRKTKEIPESFEFYIAFNPDFILNLCSEIISNCDFCLTLLKDSSMTTQIPTFLIEKCSKIIEIIIKKIPGLLSGRLILAKAKIIIRNFSGASLECNKILECNSKNEEAYILNSLIYILEKNYIHAYNSITEALSVNFEITHNPFFALLKAECEYNSNNFEDCEQTIQKVINKKYEYKKKGFGILKISTVIYSELSILLSKAKIKLNKHSESKDIIEEAILNYSDDEFARGILQIGNSEIYRISGNIKQSLQILQNITKEDKFYIIAQKKIAEIYLVEMKHPRNFAIIYETLVNNFPSIQNLVSLGDAYALINEPDEAVMAYQKALIDNEDNIEILLKLGNNLVEAHNYEVAKKFYEDKIYKSTNTSIMKSQYCKLLYKLKDFDTIEKIVEYKFLPKSKTDNNSFFENINTIKFDNYIESLSFTEMIEIIVNIMYSYLLQYNNINKNDNKSMIHVIQNFIELSDIYINICFSTLEIAKKEGKDINYVKQKISNGFIIQSEFYFKIENDFVKSQEKINECIKYNNEDIAMLFECSEKSYYNGYFSQSKDIIKRVLKSSKNNFKGLVLLMDALFVEKNFETAYKGFYKMFESNSNNFNILFCLINCLRHLGKMEVSKKILFKLKNKLAQENEDPGLALCFGIYYYFISNMNEAVDSFMIAIQNKEYKDICIMYLIEIYLNPMGRLPYNNFLSKDKFITISENSVRSIKLLLKELDNNEYNIYIALYNIIIEIINNKNIKENLQNLEFLENQTIHLKSTIIYYIFICNIKLKNSSKYKELLTKLNKVEYISYYGKDDYCLNSYLTCADFLLMKDKFDLAENKITKIFEVNKTFLQGYHFRIVINEKKKTDIIEDLLFIWKISNYKDYNIGFKLGKYYLSNCEYENVIEIGNLLIQASKSNSDEIKKKLIIPAKNKLKEF